MNHWKLFFTALLVIGGTTIFSPASGEDTDQTSDVTSADHQSGETQATLGIGVDRLPPPLTSHLPEVIGKGRGVLISHVTENSPAAQAGLRQHDVLVRYDDQDLYSPEQLVKRVRNDQPGTEVELEYVRAGKLHTAKVTLGKKPKVVSIDRDWPRLSQRFNIPMIPYKRDFLTEQQDASHEGTEWTHFESMSVIKDADGTYRAKMKYKGDDGTSIDREYTGTRQQVRDAIEADQELPESQRDQLLRSLDDRGQGAFQFPGLPLPSGPNGMPWQQVPWQQEPWQQELFNWPNLSF